MAATKSQPPSASTADQSRPMNARMAGRQRSAARGVNAPAGSFYAIEPARALGLGDAGAVRLGLAPYTDSEDVERALAAIAELAAA